MEPGHQDGVQVGRRSTYFPVSIWRRRIGLRVGSSLAGSAVVVMAAMSWFRSVRSDLSGDLAGHAAAGVWLRGLAWWDWRGWSDWFYGGQALGVNYPPLSWAWLRFTDPVHGQFAAVAVGLLVLLPWAVRSVARALRVETSPATWAVLYTIVAFAGNTHWLLPGFHSVTTGFGSWQAMIAVLLSVVCVARAFDLLKPVSTGVVTGVSVLVNSTVAPGIIVLVVVVLVGVVHMDRRQVGEAVRWAATVATVAVSLCGWWLVPFIDGWARLVEWRVPLRVAFHAASGQVLLVVGLVVLSLACVACVGRRGRLLGAAVVTVVVAAAIADAAGYLRTERWVTPAAATIIVLCAVAAPTLGRKLATLAPKNGIDGAQGHSGPGSEPVSTQTARPGSSYGSSMGASPGGAPRDEAPIGFDGAAGGSAVSPEPRDDAASLSGSGAEGPEGPAKPGDDRTRVSSGGGGRWVWLDGSRRPFYGRCFVAAAGAAAALTGVWAAVPVAVWVLWARRWSVVRYAAPAWCALLIAIPAASLFDVPPRGDTRSASAAMALTDSADENNTGGFVYLQQSFTHARGGLGNCGWDDPWAALARTDTALRPLTGLYRETSPTAEFLDPETSQRGFALALGPPMDQWTQAWDATPPGAPIDGQQAATALGASWYVFCDSTDTITTRQLAPRRISGVGLAAQPGDDAWHRDATVWWAALLTNQTTLTEAEAAVPAVGAADWEAYPPSQAATGVSLLEAGESFAATAEAAGWAWIRVPWDPYWHSHDGTPVLKGGPGHIVAWIDEGQNDYGWWVPRHVDIAAIATTATAAALALVLLITTRRRPPAGPGCCRPAAPPPPDPRGPGPPAGPKRPGPQQPAGLGGPQGSGSPRRVNRGAATPGAAAGAAAVSVLIPVWDEQETIQGVAAGALAACAALGVRAECVVCVDARTADRSARAAAAAVGAAVPDPLTGMFACRTTQLTALAHNPRTCPPGGCKLLLALLADTPPPDHPRHHRLRAPQPRRLPHEPPNRPNTRRPTGPPRRTPPNRRPLQCRRGCLVTLSGEAGCAGAGEARSGINCGYTSGYRETDGGPRSSVP